MWPFKKKIKMETILTPPNSAGWFTFQLTGEKVPILELNRDGNFYVKGKLIVNDIEIYYAMKEFLEKSNTKIEVEND